MAEPNGNGATGSPPVANRAVVELELKRALSRRAGRADVVGKRLLLLRAAPQWRGDDVFTADLGDAANGPVTVSVAACRTVLSVLEALSTDRKDNSYLVVLTPCRELGESVLAQAIEPGILPVNRWDLLRDAFGTKKLEPSLTRSANSWLAEALLDAQPSGGWRKLTGPVLGRETAMHRLAVVRLGLSGDADDAGVDAAALLEWTLDVPAVSSFRKLQEEERNGITGWLQGSVGPVAEVIFTMMSRANVTDAVPFGLAIAALYSAQGRHQHEVLTARGRAVERYLGGQLPNDTLVAFGEAASSLVGRWTDYGRAAIAASLCERAEAILAALGAGDVAAESDVLDAGFDARLAALGDAVSGALPAPDAARLRAAEQALGQVRGHRRMSMRPAEVRAAEAAVRVARWLATPEETSSALRDATLRDLALGMLRSWGWADRALTIIAQADTSRVPRLGNVYAKLWDTATARRARLDQAFARKLAAWTQSSGTTSDLLLVENFMERIGKPVAKTRPPLVLVLDGMTVAAGCDLAAELTHGGLWLEAGRLDDGREPVLATVPSVTSISRTSLLTGKLCSGGQHEERSGFSAFWGNRKARLFHKGDLAADPGRSLNPQVRDALLDSDTVVGVVLNTIDDMLNPGRQGNESHWEVSQVAYLKPVLDEARRAGRPVILTADHGHVLDRGRPIHPAESESARYRVGKPGDGEITVRGPRVLVPGEEVVAAVDEAIHYLPKRAGYHGGAAPAEVVVPVIVLLPSSSLVPDGWHSYEANGHAPIWWDPPQAAPGLPAPVKPAAVRVEEPNDVLFGIRDIMPSADAGQLEPSTTDKPTPLPSLGARVVASGRLASQRQFARRAPDDDRIARLIDELDKLGGRATIGEAARAAGEPAVRMSGYLAQVARLLNVDSYPVIKTIDDGRTVELNTGLLKEQFLGDTT
jgi:hypothetical protein